jgi:hypothetical protein
VINLTDDLLFTYFQEIPDNSAGPDANLIWDELYPQVFFEFLAQFTLVDPEHHVSSEQFLYVSEFSVLILCSVSYSVVRVARRKEGDVRGIQATTVTKLIEDFSAEKVVVIQFSSGNTHVGVVAHFEHTLDEVNVTGMRKVEPAKRDRPSRRK